MITFENLKVSDDTQKILDSFNNKIDFVFQPIFDKNLNIVCREALMRPTDMTITELIEKSIKDNTLHNLELATFFGATIAYKKRNYTERFSMNSFPSECFSLKEAKEYSESFKPIKEKMVIEILEYMIAKQEVWDIKLKHTKDYPGILISLDDFGSGFNGLGAVDYFNPRVVKIDRSLISEIDHNPTKQKSLSKFTNLFHKENRFIVAEGIETKGEFEYLKNQNIDYFQGFFLGRPE